MNTYNKARWAHQRQQLAAEENIGLMPSWLFNWQVYGKCFFLSKININTSCFCLYIWCIITSCIEGNRFVIKQFLPQLLTIWSSHNFFSINLQWSWVDYLFLIYLAILTFKWKFLLHIAFLIYLWWRISISAIQRTYTDKIILPIINHESPTKGHGQLARQRRALGFLVYRSRYVPIWVLV